MPASEVTFAGKVYVVIIGMYMERQFQSVQGSGLGTVLDAVAPETCGHIGAACPRDARFRQTGLQGMGGERENFHA